MKIETAINFMLYTLMEVTLNDLDENGDSVDEEYYIKKAVRRAYRDASSHVLSIKEGKDDSKKNPCKKEEAISAVVYEVKSINNDYNNYECWHSHVCKDLTERIYNTYECFILGKHTARKDVASISPPRREFQKC